MTRTKPPEERRADLIAAGQALFVTKGIAATTLEEITKGAGVSKGLFYQYFSSKEALVFALQEQFSNQFAEHVREVAGAKSDWGSKLDACVQASFEWYRELHDLHEVLFRHSGHGEGSGDHRPAHAGLAQALRRLLEEGGAAGVFHVDDPETTAVLLYVAMHAFDPSVHRSGRSSDARLLSAMQQLFRRAAGLGETTPANKRAHRRRK